MSTTFTRFFACLALLLALGLVGCRGPSRTEPDYRPRNPPPAPQMTPRALEHSLSNEVEGEAAEKLKGEAESAAESDAPDAGSTEADE